MRRTWYSYVQIFCENGLVDDVAFEPHVFLFAILNMGCKANKIIVF